jgi:phage terminase small subunit
MKQRGRKSSAATLVDISVDGLPSRPEPPDHLSADERRRFIDIVANCDARHFRHSDLPLLCRFVEADALAERAAKELRKNAVLKNGKPNAWLAVQEKTVRALVSLAMRLRLAPQSRIDARATGRQQPGRPSAYDTMGFDKEFFEDGWKS